jgi:outer membrane protein OmpA-like peptidoglycan-associated protein
MIRKTLLSLTMIATVLGQVYSQTYLKRKVNLDSTEIRNELNVICEKSKNPFRFISNRCDNAYEYLKAIDKFIQSDDTAAIVSVMCEFNPYDFSKSEKWKYFINKDKEFIENYIENTEYVNKIKMSIDEYRYNVASAEHTKPAYYEYISGCKELSQSQKNHIEEAEKQIFLLSNPRLYKIAPHREKLKDLINYLEDERNDTSIYYFEGLLSTYLIYTNDGQRKSIENIYKNPRFQTCMKDRLNNNEQDSLKGLFANDIKQANLYERIKNNPDMSKDSIKLYIKNNPTKESAYRLFLRLNQKNISNKDIGFIASANSLKKIFPVYNDDSIYKLYPGFRRKLIKTLELFTNSVDNWFNSPSFSKKSKAGYGPIDKVFITNKSYVIFINGNGINNISSVDVKTGSFKNEDYDTDIVDISPDEKNITIYDKNKFYRLISSNSLFSSDFSEIYDSKIPIDFDTSLSANMNNKRADLTKVQNKEKVYIFNSNDNDSIYKDWPLPNKSHLGKKQQDLFITNREYYEGFSNINTRFDEIKGYIVYDTLYFASNAYYGFGGFDLYKSVFKNGKWSYPENLGYGINTEYDDIEYKKLGGKDAIIREIPVCDDDTLSLPSFNNKYRTAHTSKSNDSNIDYHTIGFQFQPRSYNSEDTNTFKIVNSYDKNGNNIHTGYFVNNTIFVRLPKGFDARSLTITVENRKSYTEYKPKEIIGKEVIPKMVSQNMPQTISKAAAKQNDTLASGTFKEYQNEIPIYSTIAYNEFSQGKTAKMNFYYKTNEFLVDTINFKTKEAKLLYGRLTNYMANMSKERGDMKFKMEAHGYADIRGSKEHNLKLSKNRSKFLINAFEANEAHEHINYDISRKSFGHGETVEFGTDFQNNRVVILKVKRLK